MFTPFVTALVLANATAAAFASPWAAFNRALSSIDEGNQTLKKIKQGGCLLLGRGSLAEIKTDIEKRPTMKISGDVRGMVEDMAMRKKAA